MIDPASTVVIEADSTSGEDSAYESEAESTQSLTDSVRHHVFENGRRYHGYKRDDVSYQFPNDEKEMDRMDMLYHVMRLGSGGALYHAPLGSNPQNILDIACGTGLWAMDIGDEFPSAKVIGTDLSPIQPEWVPPNVEFQVDDFEGEWTFKEHFDFVRIANIIGAPRSYKDLITKAFRFLKPGGYFEIGEGSMIPTCSDGSMTPDCKYLKWTQLLAETSLTHGGRTLAPDWDWKEMLRDIGFKNIKQHTDIFPVNPWPKDKKLKEMGAYMRLFLEEGLEAVSYGLLVSVKGMEMEEVDEMLKGVRADLRDRKLHMWYPFHYTWGQKPLDYEDSPEPA